MILYHGSNVIVERPRLVPQSRTLDFGPRFYTTTNSDWLDFVFENRKGSYAGPSYDIIFGPVANDTIYRTFVAYEDGILTREETITRLKVKKLYDQMVFASDAAIKTLRFTGALAMEDDGNE